MYKNQLQELAQRSCFNLPSYACIREGPDHAPRFKASVNFNGEIFESPTYCSTVRQAEHAAAEVALISLSSRGPSRSLTARVLDETGIYKNLLQETAHRAGLNLPVYTSIRSGPGHIPTFSCKVELAGMSFTGEPAKTKKQAEKNAAISAWSALKKVQSLEAMEEEEGEEKEQEVVARVLSSFRPKEAKRRDQNQNQARRRTIRSYKDTTTDGVWLNEKWRLMNSLRDEDFSSSSSSSQQSQKHQPRKPLISSLHEEFKGKAQVFTQRSDAKPEKIMPFPLPMSEKSISNDSPIHNSYSKHLRRGLHNCKGVYSSKPQRMAPAVQIRSVIPVCAAPPQTTRPNPNPTTSSSSSVNESRSRPFCPSVPNGGDNLEKCPSPSPISCEMKKLGL